MAMKKVALLSDQKCPTKLGCRKSELLNIKHEPAKDLHTLYLEGLQRCSPFFILLYKE